MTNRGATLPSATRSAAPGLSNETRQFGEAVAEETVMEITLAGAPVFWGFFTVNVRKSPLPTGHPDAAGNVKGLTSLSGDSTVESELSIW